MFGGVARWLRMLGVDASFTPGIEDAALVEHARGESRILISSDGRLFERRALASGEVAGLRVPVGLALEDQVRFVVESLRIRPGFPRCSACNGELAAVSRDEIADRVPARSLIWAREFFICTVCGHVFWEGTHWRRISVIRKSLAGLGDDPSASPARP